MSSKNHDLFVFAGELSGDKQAALILSSLLELNPSLKMTGVLGPQMRKLSLQTFMPTENFMVMGFQDVLKSIPALISYFFKIEKWILHNQPKAVLTIDYAEFSLFLMKRLRKKGYKGKLLHYICPTVWAHGKKRVQTLEKHLDKLFSIFPFEKKFFDPSLEVSYVGHPLMEAIPENSSDRENLIALFPGSRRGEVEKNLLVMLQGASLFYAQNPSYRFILSIAFPKLRSLIEEKVRSFPHLPLQLIEGADNLFYFPKIKAAISVSGTMNLELGIGGVPTVMVYALTRLDYLFARYFLKIKLPFYSMVNILLERAVFPELVYEDLTARNIFESLSSLLEPTTYTQALRACLELRSILKTKMPPRIQIASEIYETLTL